MRKLKIEYVDINKLKEWKDNPRINDEASKRLAKLIRHYDFINPIIATPDGTIRAGHTRLKAAKIEGMKEVPVIFVKFDNEKDARGYSISDNKSVEFAEWDLPSLKDIFEEMNIEGFDTKLTGFDKNEIKDILTRFNPVDEGEQSSLDEIDKKEVICPYCGEAFEA